MKAIIGFISVVLLLVLSAFAFHSNSSNSNPALKKNTQLETATFAGGCFWCMEPPYEKQDGVIKVTPGYTGGHTKNPTYKR